MKKSLSSIITFLFLAVFFAQDVKAQDKDVLKRMQELEKRLEEQEKKIDEQQKEIEKLKSEGDEPLNRKDRIKRRMAEEVQKHKQEEDKEKEKSLITATFKDGLKFKSGDGNFEAHIGGRFLEHARFSLDGLDGARAATNSFFVRQARLEMSGTFYKNFDFKVQTDFPTGAAAISGTLQDGYIGWKQYPEFSLRFGQFKEPFSQEETTSTRFIDFVERSNLNRLAPARDIGIGAYGKLFDDYLQYEVGMFN